MRKLVCATLVALTMPAGTAAQEIEQSHVVTLAGRDGDGLPWTEYAATQFGNKWITGARGDLSVYSADGAWLRDVGREGQGPGEWNQIMAFATRGDSLFVYDRRNARVTVLDDGFEVVRTFPLPTGIADIIPLDDGRFVVSGRPALPDRETKGRAIFFLDGKGEIEFATGEFDMIPHRATARGVSWITRDEDGAIWSLDLYEPRLRHFAPDGAELRTIDLPRPDWWVTSFLDRDFKMYTPDQVPPSINVGNRVVGDRVWTLTNTPAEDWRDAFSDELQQAEGVEYREFNPLAGYRTVVEVRDRSSGDLVTRKFLDGFSYASDLVDRGYRIVLRQNDVGLTFVEIYTLTLKEN